MTRSPRSCKTISDSVHRELNMYALAASAAGVGALALAQPANAKIVYTPAHLVVKVGDRDCVDINNDGKPDFCLAMSSHEGGCFVMALGPYTHNGVAASDRGFGALPIHAGKRIGGSRNFIDSTRFPRMVSMNRYCFSSIWSGLWIAGGKGKKGLTNRYLGIEFASRGQLHYGWARCSVYPGKLSHPLIMTGYAYETIPGKPIIAGATKDTDDNTVEQPDAALTSPMDDTPQLATLGALALGAPGLSIWRREDSVGAVQ